VRVLIAGAHGETARRLTRMLVEEGHEVRGPVVASTFAAALQDENTYHKTFVTPNDTPALTLVATAVR
jgi:nucleoside-diphosphate-sugar epimerase